MKNSDSNIPEGSPAGDALARDSVRRFVRHPDYRYDHLPLTPQLRAQWMRDQIQRDIEFFEAKQTDWLGLQAREVWNESKNPEATRTKINASLAMLDHILFRLRRMLSKKQPWNKGELKPDKADSTTLEL